jgi:FtsP/CotA-like multicopper oxidase with cupredoxin domain
MVVNSMIWPKDEFGRLQPLLGTFDDEPNEFGSIAAPHSWANPDSEKPVLNTTERWKIYNFTEDAHPIHLHLVNFEMLGRGEITFDSDDGDPGQEVIMHNEEIGLAPVITNLEIGSRVNLTPKDGYVENAPKDMVTVIKATFDKPGKYVWHCHILSHEDHEMMRVMRVV